MSSIQKTDEMASAVAKTDNRVSLASIEAKIDSVVYHNPPHDLTLTLCFITMKNGFSVIGKTKPADVANFDADLGKKFAYENAIRELWPLEGYLMCEKLTKEKENTHV